MDQGNEYENYFLKALPSLMFPFLTGKIVQCFLPIRNMQVCNISRGQVNNHLGNDFLIKSPKRVDLMKHDICNIRKLHT